jgi:hypothetical protein
MRNRLEQLSNHGSEQEIETYQIVAKQSEIVSKNPELNNKKDAVEAIYEKLDAETKEKNVGINNKKSKSSCYGSISKKQHDESYMKILRLLQNELTPTSRIFSKITHNNIIEGTSNFIGGTIARPNAMLAGALFAFILTLSVYLIAETIGYALSGSETIIAFLTGWLIGILYDYLRILTTGKIK